MPQDAWPTLSSQLAHLLCFQLSNRRAKFEKGMIIFSVDVDAGSKSLGTINKGSNDSNVNDYMSEVEVGEIEESAVPKLIGLFDELEVPATFAVRGQLAEVENTILRDLSKSSVKHDIGAHGYSHRRFTDLSKSEAENELKLIASAMGKLGIKPKSFVFPRNCVAHLDLLEKHGYTCYRGKGGSFLSDGMYIGKSGLLFDVHPTSFLWRGSNPVLGKKLIDLACKRKLPCHFWFHSWNFASPTQDCRGAMSKIGLDKAVLKQLLAHAQGEAKKRTLTLETMASAAQYARDAPG